MLRLNHVLSVLSVAGLVACTAIVTADPVQCENNGDCTKRGPDFVNTVCTAGLCTPGAANSGGIPNAECQKNADCAAKGAGMVCSSNIGKCAPTTSPDCEVAYGDPTVEGTVLFGLLSEIGKKDTNYFRQQQYKFAAKLAFTEFFETAGVRFPGNHGGALIACSEESPRKVAAFLANLGVKAVLGPSAEDRQRPVVETLLKARIPAFSPWINGNPASVVPGSDGFAWLSNFQRAEVVAPLNAYVAEKEAALRAGGKTNIRVAVVVTRSTPPSFDSFGQYTDLMDQRLIFNGKSAIENGADPACDGGACYMRFDTSQADKATVGAKAAAIAAFKPDIIIPFTDIDWGAQLLPAIEGQYGVDAPKPSYLQIFLQIEEQGYKSLPVNDPAVRSRLGGIRAVRDNSFEVFSDKFKKSLPSPSDPSQVGPDPNPGAGRSFESTLLLLFTTYAAFVEHPNATPEQMLASLPKTTDPMATRVTLTDIVPAINQLNTKTSINFDGLFTFFNLDYSSHSSPATWTTWCVGDLGQYNSTGRIFDGTTFDGTAAPCP